MTLLLRCCWLSRLLLFFVLSDSDSCFGADCGSGGDCIPLTGTYACECADGYEKTPPRTQARDRCHGKKLPPLLSQPRQRNHIFLRSTDYPTSFLDINECAGFLDNCGVRNVCENTDGAYECEYCEEGYAAFGDRSECEGDLKSFDLHKHPGCCSSLLGKVLPLMICPLLPFLSAAAGAPPSSGFMF